MPSKDLDVSLQPFNIRVAHRLTNEVPFLLTSLQALHNPSPIIGLCTWRSELLATLIAQIFTKSPEDLKEVLCESAITIGLSPACLGLILKPSRATGRFTSN